MVGRGKGMRVGMRDWRFAAALIGAVALVLVIPVPVPEQSWIASAVWNALHAPLFASVGFALLRRYGGRGSHAAGGVVVGLAGLAIASEIAQYFTGRSASWADLTANGFGIAIGFCVWRLVDGRRDTRSGALRPAVWLALFVAAGGAILPFASAVARGLDQERRFPVLVDPAMRGVSDMVASMRSHARAKVRLGAAGLEIELPPDPMPGVVVSRFLPDWRGFTWVVLDIENPGDAELALETHLGDRDSSFGYYDRFNARHLVPAHARQRIRYALADIAAAPRGRTADLAHMSAIALFRYEGGGSNLIIHSIGLE